MSFGDYAFATLATVILVALTVFCWLVAISYVQATGGELAPAIILYGLNVLANVGILGTIVKVWR